MCMWYKLSYSLLVTHSLSFSPSLPLYPVIYCCCYLLLSLLSQDLDSKSLVDEILVDRLSINGPVEYMGLAWSADGQTLFAGYTDNLIR